MIPSSVAVCHIWFHSSCRPQNTALPSMAWDPEAC